MYQINWENTSHWVNLFFIDLLAAIEVHSKPCPKCGGKLDWANFKRKPRGGPESIDHLKIEDFKTIIDKSDVPSWFLSTEPSLLIKVRMSLCCRKEGCRKRVTPPSSRFLGRKVYLELTIVMAVTRGEITLESEYLHVILAYFIQLNLIIAVRTLKRWLQFWQNKFLKSKFWTIERGNFIPPINEQKLVSSLVQCFKKINESCWWAITTALLKFLSPITETKTYRLVLFKGT